MDASSLPLTRPARSLPAVLRRAGRWTAGVLTSPAARCWLAACLFTAAVAAVGVHTLTTHHATAHYHFDSACYRMGAVEVSGWAARSGVLSAMKTCLPILNSFDVLARLAVYPPSLTWFHGHLLVELPAAALFFFQVFWLARERTGSLLPGAAASSAAFCFACVYHPVQGLMDYWKENPAVWMMGVAFLSWFLSESGSKRGWAVVCGAAWSALAWQRPVVAVYSAPLFLPLWLLGTWRRFRADSRADFFRYLVAFGAVPLVAGTAFAVFQLKGMHQYYSGYGYAYYSYGTIARHLLDHPMTGGVPFRLGLAALAVVALAGLGSRLWERRGDIAVALWLVAGLPAMVIASKAAYHSLGHLLLPAVVAALALLTPRHLTPAGVRRFSLALFLVTASVSMAQARHWAGESARLADRSGEHRQLYDAVLTHSLALPPGSNLGLFFDEVDHLVNCQAFFDRGVLPRQENRHMTVHDTYYRVWFPGKSAAEIAGIVVGRLEAGPAVAVAHADPLDLAKYLTGIGRTPDSLAVAVNTAIVRHLLGDPRWVVLRKIDSASYGPLLVYRFDPASADAASKWAHYQGDSAAAGELRVSAAVAPAVDQVALASRYPVESHAGQRFLWLPSGDPGLSLTLKSAGVAPVLFRSLVLPGPSAGGDERVLVVDHNGSRSRHVVRAPGYLAAPLTLTPGVNAVRVWCETSADRPAPNGDSRDLVARLDSPHLLPAEPPPHQLGLTAAVGPAVRAESVSARLPAELYQGVSYQWLPAGKPGLDFRVTADAPQAVYFTASVTPGPSCSRPTRTLVVVHNGAERRFTVTGQQALAVPLALIPGANTVSIWADDPADVPAGRELVTRLDSPHLALAEPVRPPSGGRVLAAEGKYPAETAGGVKYQWLASGKPAWRVVLRTETAGRATFRATLTPGPSAAGDARTLVVAHNGREQRLTVRGQQAVAVPLDLPAGDTAVELWCDDPATADRWPGEARELVLRLDAPEFRPDP